MFPQMGVVLAGLSYCEKVYTTMNDYNSIAYMYMPSSTNTENPVTKHQNIMSRQNIEIPDCMKQLLKFYWLPKMHKNPIGHRFIAASSACTTKPLSQLLTSSLKLVTKHYCEGIARNIGVNCFG